MREIVRRDQTIGESLLHEMFKITEEKKILSDPILKKIQVYLSESNNSKKSLFKLVNKLDYLKKPKKIYEGTLNSEQIIKSLHDFPAESNKNYSMIFILKFSNGAELNFDNYDDLFEKLSFNKSSKNQIIKYLEKNNIFKYRNVYENS